MNMFFTTSSGRSELWFNGGVRVRRAADDDFEHHPRGAGREAQP